MTNENLEKGKNTRFKSGKVAVENGRKGGIASGKSKRQKKLFKQLMNSYLESEESDIDNWNELSMAGFDPEDITNKAVIIKRLVDQAKKGDVQAVKLVMSIIGEDIQHDELTLKRQEHKLKEKQAEINNW